MAMMIQTGVPTPQDFATKLLAGNSRNTGMKDTIDMMKTRRIPYPRTSFAKNNIWKSPVPQP